jgi:competence protein ComEC
VKKIVNFRPLLFLFVVLCFGILTANAFLFNNLFIKIIAFIFISFLLTLLALSLFNSYFRFTFLKGKTFFILITIFVFIIGSLNLIHKVNTYESIKLNAREYTVHATITEDINYIESGARIYLKNATAVINEDTYELKKNIKLNLYNSNNQNELSISTGDQIVFVAKVYDYKLLKDNKINTYIYTNNLGYYATAYMSDVEVISGNLQLDQKLRKNVKELLNNNLSYNNSNFAYAVLFGDKSQISDTVYNSFTNSGIAHILAVSGLHIGFLVLILLFIFNQIKLNKKLQFIFMALILFSYAYLCGFSASVVRASIMALILMLAHITGEQNDNLSSLSLAGIIILLINPVSLFTAGFLLSFASVFSIFMFYSYFKNLFEKINMPNWLSSLVTLTLCAQIGTLPILIYYFNHISLLSVLTNILVLPLFTIGYVFLFFSIILTSILPFLSFLFVVPNLAFTFVYLIAMLISSIKFASIELFTFSFFASVVYYILIFIISRFVIIENKVKLLTISVLTVVMIISLVFVNLPSNFNYYSVTKISNVNSASFITTASNNNYLVDVGEGSEWDIYNIENFLNKKRVKNLQGIILTNYDAQKQQAVSVISKNYNVNKLFIPYSTNNVSLYGLTLDLPSFTNIVLLNSAEQVNDHNISITSYSQNKVGYAVNIELNNYNILFASSNLSTENINNVGNLINEHTSVLVLGEINTNINNVLSENTNFYDLNYMLVTYNHLNYKPPKLYDTYSYTNLLVTFNYDKLYLSY